MVIKTGTIFSHFMEWEKKDLGWLFFWYWLKDRGLDAGIWRVFVFVTKCTVGLDAIQLTIYSTVFGHRYRAVLMWQEMFTKRRIFHEVIPADRLIKSSWIQMLPLSKFRPVVRPWTQGVQWVSVETAICIYVYHIYCYIVHKIFINIIYAHE